MGDRGNIVVKEYDDSEIFLYTHWGRWKLHHILADALSKNERWDDTPYLTRIIFSEMIKDDIEGTTGYGISTHLGDGDRTLVVNPKNQTIEFNGDTWTFNNFVLSWGIV